MPDLEKKVFWGRLEDSLKEIKTEISKVENAICELNKTLKKIQEQTKYG